MITCIGIGPGDPDYLTKKGADAIREAEVVCGFNTVVDFVKDLIAEGATVVEMSYKDQTTKLEEVAGYHKQGRDCVVLAMGDIHFSGFQLLERVDIACGEKVSTIPGISSSQILASKCRVCFDETTFITFHRRGELQPFKTHLTHVLQDDRNAIVIPHPWDFMPNAIAEYLMENGIPADLKVEIWENLTGAEAEWKGTLADCEQEFSHMSIMLIRTANQVPTGI